MTHFRGVELKNIVLEFRYAPTPLKWFSFILLYVLYKRNNFTVEMVLVDEQSKLIRILQLCAIRFVQTQ